MSAYMIFFREALHDTSLYAEYGAKARPTMAGHEIKPLAYYGNMESLEGEPPEGVVVLKFPTMEAARAWYFGEGYQSAKAIREKAGDFRVVLVEGLD